MSELLTTKGLAEKMKRNPDYIYGMKRDGFKMPGGTATLESALLHLEEHPFPRRNRRPRVGKRRKTS